MFWIEFIICSILLTFFAYHLSKEGVILSKKTHISEGLVGMFFLAVATSFPEITTGVTAVHSLGRISLGYGDLIGSVIVNFMILMGLDYFSGRGRILSRISNANRYTAISILAVTAFVVLAAVSRRLSGSSSVSLGPIGVESIFIVGAYLFSLELIRRKDGAINDDFLIKKEQTFFEVWAKFIVLLLVVVLLGAWMAGIGDKIVSGTGMSQTFAGTLLLGFATSLPEIIVSFAALRAASIDMAVGNILGSNLFDICILPVLDLFTPGPIFSMLSTPDIAATLIALTIAIIAFSGVLKRDPGNRMVGMDTFLIFVVGFAGFVLLYLMK